ncbi:MAG: DUF177 domain-containing protein [Pseudomonadota bacterium]
MPDPTQDLGKIRVADLNQSVTTQVQLRPDPAACAEIAAQLKLMGLRKLRFDARIEASGNRDWQLTGTLGATVVQPCGVTLAPVTTRIDTSVRRLFVADLEEPEGDEVEMPDDEDQERLGREIDVAAVMTEALALALPLYPRADDAELEQTDFTEPGKEALRDEDVKPFAALAALKASLNKTDDG